MVIFCREESLTRKNEYAILTGRNVRFVRWRIRLYDANDANARKTGFFEEEISIKSVAVVPVHGACLSFAVGHNRRDGDHYL